MKLDRRTLPIALMAIGAVGLAIFLMDRPFGPKKSPPEIDPPTDLEIRAVERADRLDTTNVGAIVPATLVVGEHWTLAVEIESEVSKSSIRDDGVPATQPSTAEGRVNFSVRDVCADGWIVAASIREIAPKTTTSEDRRFDLIFKRNGEISWSTRNPDLERNPAETIFRLSGVVVGEGVLEIDDTLRDDPSKMRSSFRSPHADVLLGRLGCLVGRSARPPVVRSSVALGSGTDDRPFELEIVRYSRRLALGPDWTGRFESLVDGKFVAKKGRRHRLEGTYILREIIHVERPQKITADADLTSTARQFLVE